MADTLVNVTRLTVVATNVEEARGFFARMRGLLGRRGLDRGAALILAPCSSVHSLGMRFDVEVLFLSSDGCRGRKPHPRLARGRGEALNRHAASRSSNTGGRGGARRRGGSIAHQFVVT